MIAQKAKTREKLKNAYWELVDKLALEHAELDPSLESVVVFKDTRNKHLKLAEITEAVPADESVIPFTSTRKHRNIEFEVTIILIHPLVWMNISTVAGRKIMLPKGWSNLMPYLVVKRSKSQKDETVYKKKDDDSSQDLF